MRSAPFLMLIGTASLAATLGACSSSNTSGFTPGGDDGGSSGDGGGGPDGGGPSDGPGFGDVISGDDGGPGKTLLYAHTNTTLFSVDPTDPKLALTKIGDFDCIGNGGATAMTDLAVDKDGKLYAVSGRDVYLDMKINGTTVQCAQNSKPLPSNTGTFYGASFAPAGTLDPSVETLITANSGGDLYVVDTATGNATLVGNFGNVPANDGNGFTYQHAGTRWELSGDIVFLENNGNPVGFATVRDCPTPPSTTGCDRTDTLIEIDATKLSKQNPTNVTTSVRGAVVKAQGCNDPNNTSYGSMYGIAAFQGDIIGFSRIYSSQQSAELSLVVRIDNNKGTACLVADDTAQAPGGWAGAGVTTKAPVIKPPPK
jgi:hypothetical protein